MPAATRSMSSVEPVTVFLGDGPTVEAVNRSGDPDIDVERWALVALETLVAETVTRGHLDLTFVDPGAMTELNRAHMGQDGPTDVLSFPLDGEDDIGPGPEAVGSDSPPALLGDVVICPQVALAQAPDHCGDPQTEFTLLVVHGVLHVLGHDHAEPDEEGVMIRHETQHLQRYGMIHPGPVRSETTPP